MNALGDDFVSFVAMHLTFSPDGKYILVSTGEMESMFSIKESL